MERQNKTTSGGFPLFQYMDVNTSHLTPTDWKLLEKECDGQENLTVYPRKSGFFLFVNNDDELQEIVKQLGFSESFLSIWRDAVENAIWWILFHEDGCFQQKTPSLA